MGRHNTQVKRSGEGVIGTCSCRHKQLEPVATKQEAEDWIFHHLEQVVRAQADPGKQLSGPLYLAHLRAMAASPAASKSDRALWSQLADEHERRLTSPPPRGDLPQSPNAKYNTGVETDPLW